MADLISRAYILEALGHFNDYVNGDPHFLNGIETAKEITENAPAVDAAPVVRCKDCMYFRPWRHDRGDDSRCELWNTEMGAEDYCSQAIYLNNGRDDGGKDA